MVSTRLKVASAFRFSSESQQMLNEAAGTQIIYVTSDEELAACLANLDVLCGYTLPANWREAAPRLHWLQFPGAGVDSLQSSGLLERGSPIVITTAAGIHATTIAEYVFGSMLMFNWNWPQMLRLQDQHIWARSASWYNLGKHELSGQTLGIVGLGSIGRRIAQVGRAFRMRVLATRHTPPREGQHDPDADELFPRERLHDLLSQSDYVVLSIPLSPDTEGLIGEAELRAMRQDAYLVNVARGRIVDEAALIRALREGWIAGAGLDVTETEPLPAESPLYTMPNVILTPHISGNSIHYNERLAALFADNLRRYRAGEPLLNRYDPARGY
ncbi:MAG TPA: D-2-hydroxyacid dehydrogenase [Ktedonobacteraceae bacterium]|nr:D-2-hydroxyacid dehydrogenase [Ktedonobacteraceae bacterium]